MRTITANVCYDRKDKLWFVRHCDVPGITAKTQTLDELCTKLPSLILGLIEASGELSTEEAKIKVTIYPSTRVRKSVRINHDHSYQ